jgi:hypothetical protein
LEAPDQRRAGHRRREQRERERVAGGAFAEPKAGEEPPGERCVKAEQRD